MTSFPALRISTQHAEPQQLKSWVSARRRLIHVEGEPVTRNVTTHVGINV
jgi:hypothetical protein